MKYNFKTSCQNCIFAIYNNNGINDIIDKNKKTQTGCLANRLQYFDTLECYNEDGEFYVTLNYPCNLYRTEYWAKKQTSELLESARNEIKFKYCIITSIKDISKKLENINKQEIQPYKIYCYTYDDKENRPRQKNIEYIQFIESNNNPIQKIIKRIKKKTNIFYLEEADTLNIDFIRNLDIEINDKLNKKTIFFSKKDASFIMPSVYHSIYPTYTYNKILEEISKNIPEAIGYIEEI